MEKARLVGLGNSWKWRRGKFGGGRMKGLDSYWFNDYLALYAPLPTRISTWMAQALVISKSQVELLPCFCWRVGEHSSGFGTRFSPCAILLSTPVPLSEEPALCVGYVHGYIYVFAKDVHYFCACFQFISMVLFYSFHSVSFQSTLELFITENFRHSLKSKEFHSTFHLWDLVCCCDCCVLWLACCAPTIILPPCQLLGAKLWWNFL